MTEVELGDFIPAPDAGKPGPRSKDIEYALLYGLHVEGNFAMASISTGTSLVESHHVIGAHAVDFLYFLESYARENVISLGFPLEARPIFNMGSHICLGAISFANFNRYYPHIGGFMSIRYTFH